jgi:cytochrome b involved in lipid metabolism
MEPEPKSGVAKYVIGIVIIALIIVGVSFVNRKQNKNSEYQNQPETSTPIQSATQNTQSSPVASPAAATTKTFTMADVLTHNNKDDCYTTVRGSVYDVTSWIYKHPGGAEKILALCGKDGTSAFEGKHGGQARPETELASFKIGELK